MLLQCDQCIILADLMWNLKYNVDCFKKIVMMHIIVQHFFDILENFCIQYCQWTCLISADNKHKIPIGEDVAVSTGVQN